MVRHIIVLMCHVCGIYVFVSSCKCYSRLVNVCHGFVPSCFCYFCHSNVFHAHACHAIVCHAIVTSCKCLSCKRDHVNERHTSASSRVPRWLRDVTDQCSASRKRVLSKQTDVSNMKKKYAFIGFPMMLNWLLRTPNRMF